MLLAGAKGSSSSRGLGRSVLSCALGEPQLLRAGRGQALPSLLLRGSSGTAPESCGGLGRVPGLCAHSQCQAGKSGLCSDSLLPGSLQSAELLQTKAPPSRGAGAV